MSLLLRRLMIFLAKYCQQVERCDPFPHSDLVRLAATRVLCPVQDPSVKERRGHIGHSQTEGHQSNLL